MFLTKRFNVVTFDLFLVSFLAQRDLCVLCCVLEALSYLSTEMFSPKCAMLKYAQNKPLQIKLLKFNQHQVLSPTSHGSSLSRHATASETPSFFRSVQILKSSVNNTIIHVDNLNPWNDRHIKIFLITTGTRPQILCNGPSDIDDSHSESRIPEDSREAYPWR